MAAHWFLFLTDMGLAQSDLSTPFGAGLVDAGIYQNRHGETK